MGIWRRARTFKFSDEESAMLLAIHESLAPMHETESQTVRWLVRTMHMMIFTPGILPRVNKALQGLQRGTVFAFPAPAAQEQVEGRKPRQAQRIAR
jgi:hypothetical protein